MSYLKWAETHAAGMAASAERTASLRLTGETLARVRRENNERHPCGVKGCKRTSYKGALCKGHWDTVPLAERSAMVMALIDAQIRVRDKYHRRFLSIARAKAKA